MASFRTCKNLHRVLPALVAGVLYSTSSQRIPSYVLSSQYSSCSPGVSWQRFLIRAALYHDLDHCSSKQSSGLCALAPKHLSELPIFFSIFVFFLKSQFSFHCLQRYSPSGILDFIISTFESPILMYNTRGDPLSHHSSTSFRPSELTRRMHI